jgi:hypothetical protein
MSIREFKVSIGQIANCPSSDATLHIYFKTNYYRTVTCRCARIVQVRVTIPVLDTILSLPKRMSEGGPNPRQLCRPL